MSFIKKTFNLLTDRRDIKEPVIMKDFNERTDFLQALEMLAGSDEPVINKEKAERDLKLFSIGQAGERNVFYELKHSMLPIMILNDVNIEYEDYEAQIDFVVITHKFILALEVKKLFGDVKVTDKGEFQRVIKHRNRVVKQEGMYSPVNQVERHAAILERFLKANKVINRCPVRTAVTFANPKTILDISKKAPASIQTRTIRHDQIKMFLKAELEKESKTYMMDDQLYKIADFLVQNNKEKPFEKERYLLPADELDSSNTTTEQSNRSKLSDDELREKLKEFRLERSRKLGVKAFHIFTNKTMEVLIEKRPATVEELLEIPGFGEKKVEEFGEELVGILKR